MTRTRALVLGGLALLVAGLVAFFLRGGPATPAPVSAAQWPVGTEKTYRLTLRAHAELPGVDPRGPAAPSDLVTTGLVRLRSYRADGGFLKLGLSLARLDEATMTVFGEPAMQDRAALVAALTSGEAVLTVRPEGDLVDVDFTPGSHNLFKTFAQTLAGELQLPVRDGATWTVVDTTLRGKAEATYQRTADGFRRTRPRYVKLTAFGQGLREVTVAAETRFVVGAGGLTSLDSREALGGFTPEGAPVQSALELSLEPVDAAPLAAVLPTQLEDSSPGEVVRPADWKAQMLAQRIAGLTPQQMMDGVAMNAAGASVESVARFLPRASGLLLQHPELCLALAERAKAPTTPAKERVFALELLAAAGSAEAQAAMRDILSSEALTNDPARVERFQRLSLLRRPTAETVAYAGEAWRRGSPAERQTLALVVGATAGMLSRTGGEAEAGPWVAELRQALQGARDLEERRALVGALGNAGLESAVPDVLAALRSPDEALRADAVIALRKTPVPEARQAAVQALQDPALPVKAEAVELLRRWKPDDAERAALIAAVRAGRLPMSVLHEVVSALEPFAAQPDVKAFFEWLSVQREADPSLQRRARVLAGGTL